MVNKQTLDKIRAIATEYSATVRFEEAADNSYVDCEIVKGNHKIYLTLTNFNNQYYAYNLSFDGAPSGIYTDLKSDEPSDLKRREEEIFQNIGQLLDNKLAFHKASSLFNRNRGYLDIQIDGKLTKVWMKDNLLNFPEV